MKIIIKTLMKMKLIMIIIININIMIIPVLWNLMGVG